MTDDRHEQDIMHPARLFARLGDLLCNSIFARQWHAHGGIWLHAGRGGNLFSRCSRISDRRNGVRRIILREAGLRHSERRRESQQSRKKKRFHHIHKRLDTP